MHNFYLFYQGGSYEQVYWISSLSLKVASDKRERGEGKKKGKVLEHLVEPP